MAAIYFTITGTSYRHGQEFFEKDMIVGLVKEPDNEFDKEAVRVELPGLGHVGYVANSPRTVLGESYSAGRLYDKIGDRALGTVMYVLPKGVLCRLQADLTDPGEEWIDFLSGKDERVDSLSDKKRRKKTNE